MAQELLITNTFEHLSGFPEDRIVNTFPVAWTGAGSASPADLDDALDAVIGFFNNPSNTFEVARYLSTEINRTGPVSIARVYNLVGHLDGSAHGSPLLEKAWQLGNVGGSNNLPGEVAAVLTTRASGWQGAAIEAPDGPDAGTAVDRPRQRLSGRLFLGPLRDLTIDTSALTVRLSPTFRSDVMQAANLFHQDLVAQGFRWMVWSRKNAAMEPVTHIQMDDAYDTQRRRGPDALSRTTFALP